MHEVYGVHVAAFVVVLNPVVQPAQTRLLVGVPGTNTYWPGIHVAYGAHTLSLVVVPGVVR